MRFAASVTQGPDSKYGGSSGIGREDPSVELVGSVVTTVDDVVPALMDTGADVVVVFRFATSCSLDVEHAVRKAKMQTTSTFLLIVHLLALFSIVLPV